MNLEKMLHKRRSQFVSKAIYEVRGQLFESDQLKFDEITTLHMKIILKRPAEEEEVRIETFLLFLK